MLPDLRRSPAGTMKLLGGDPCLDFVNTVGGRVPDARGPGTRVTDDKLVSYDDLVAFGLHRGILGDVTARGLLRRARARPAAARAAVERARAFREALHRTLRALMGQKRPLPGDLDRINAEVRACRTRESAQGARSVAPLGVAELAGDADHALVAASSVSRPPSSRRASCLDSASAAARAAAGSSSIGAATAGAAGVRWTTAATWRRCGASVKRQAGR